MQIEGLTFRHLDTILFTDVRTGERHYGVLLGAYTGDDDSELSLVGLDARCFIGPLILEQSIKDVQLVGKAKTLFDCELREWLEAKVREKATRLRAEGDIAAFVQYYKSLAALTDSLHFDIAPIKPCPLSGDQAPRFFVAEKTEAPVFTCVGEFTVGLSPECRMIRKVYREENSKKLCFLEGKDREPTWIGASDLAEFFLRAED